MLIVVFQARDRDNKNFNFKVFRNVVLKALCWLRKHVLNKNTVINMKRVNKIPKDDYLDVCRISIKERNKSSDAYDCGAVEDKENDSLIESSSFLSTNTNAQPRELGSLKDALEPNTTIEIDQNALSEFTAPPIPSMAFQTLFPDGAQEPNYQGNNKINQCQ